jgi:CRP-like cAMP-binding protein
MTTENTTSTQLRLNAPVSDIATLLQSNPLFAETDLVALKKLLDRRRILALRPGDALLRQGEPSDAAYIVIEGSASIRIECRFSM